MTISPEMIAAYADGELEGEAARAAEAAIAADPDLQTQLEAYRVLRERLCAHFAPIVIEPVPEHLLALIDKSSAASNVVDFMAVTRERDGRSLRKRQWSRLVGPALAASLVLAVVGFGLARHTTAGYAQGEIATALDDQLVATQTADAPVRILLSFRDATGRFCRGFSAAGTAGIACHDDRGWRLGKFIGNTANARQQYSQAGSADAEIMAAIQDLANGAALDAGGEAEARQTGWRNPVRGGQ